MAASSVDLILLGLLKKQPMNPYELWKFIEFRGLSTIVKISEPAVYKNVHRLHKAGFLDKTTEKTGDLPEKSIYRVTKDGEKKFGELMEHFATNPGGIFFDFNAMVAFLGFVDKKKAVELLSVLQESIRTRSQVIDGLLENKPENKDYPPFPQEGTEILNQYSQFLGTIDSWVSGIIKRKKK